MERYFNLVNYVKQTGTLKENRTGVRTLSSFNYNYEVDLTKGFPLLTTKKIDFKSVVIELLWFLSGTDCVDFLHKHNVNFWNPWVVDKKLNTTNTQYHYITRYPCTDGYVDQLAKITQELKDNPYSRRLVFSLWEPSVAWTSHLPPCGFLSIFNVQKNTDGKPELNLHLTQRSGDVAVGIPWNIASQALLLSIIGKILNLTVRKFAHSIIDAHIYAGKEDGDKDDHRPNLEVQLQRTPKKLSSLMIDDRLNSYEYLMHLAKDDLTTEEIMSHFILENYNPDPFLKFSAIV